MKKPLLIAIIIVIVVIGGYFIYDQLSSTEDAHEAVSGNVNQSALELSDENINTSVASETAGWLTYRNATAGFALQYPPENWEIETVAGQDPHTTMTPTFRYCGYQEGSSFLGFYAYDYEIAEDATLEEQFVVIDLDKILEQKFITLGGERAMQTKFLRQRYETPEEFIDVIHNQRAYRVFLGQEPEEVCRNDLERTGTYSDFQDRILSTFEFID